MRRISSPVGGCSESLSNEKIATSSCDRGARVIGQIRESPRGQQLVNASVRFTAKLIIFVVGPYVSPFYDQVQVSQSSALEEHHAPMSIYVSVFLEAI